MDAAINMTLKQAVSGDQPQPINITRAARLCGCSPSKISKFVKKLGFPNYKTYITFLCGKDPPARPASGEFDRIRHFLDRFDRSLVEQFADFVKLYNKIILFGYGPSFICAQYFAYKLNIVANKYIIAVPDEISVRSLLDENSMLVIFSATGNFRSFSDLYTTAKSKGSECLMILEEYNPSLIKEFDKIFVLTDTRQDDALNPYEKSRIVFFIFIEEVIMYIIKNPLSPPQKDPQE
ncbi:MAG: SIS domain-containing protein [Spirochaetaceae bacterium]|jgi:DNA-binding MurR/RpiR family transcriptional regulator|nr:SIS domain-containing protein [Spirochaetaceae bacterium]